MLLPCLELTIVAHQPLPKPYSTVVTVAGLPTRGQGAILNYYYYCLTEEPDWVSINPVFPTSCMSLIMTLKKTETHEKNS